VANVAIAGVVLFSIATLATVLLQFAPGQPDRRLRAGIGLILGVIGALVVGALVTDLVPDAFEAVAFPWVIAGSTVGIVALTIINLRAH
jgi:hypothetical protein